MLLPGTKPLRPALNEWRPTFLVTPKGSARPRSSPDHAPGPSAFADVPAHGRQKKDWRDEDAPRTRDLKSWLRQAAQLPRQERHRERAAEFIKSRNPLNEVAVKDLDSGELTVVAYKPRPI